MISVYKPYLNKENLKFAHDALDSGWISSRGEYIEKATDLLKNILKVENLLLVNNGTSATHLISKAALYKNENLNILIVPENVYAAAYNSFLFDSSNNIKIEVAEIDYDTWNYDLKSLDVLISKYNNNITVLIVHNLGNIINVPELKRKYSHVRFVEDNCEGLFGKYEDNYSGTKSLASSISFFGNKNVTSGEGGAVIVDDKETFDYINCIHGQGQSDKKFIHKCLGYNYRITNIQAAILYGQLLQKDIILNKKAELFSKYKQILNGIVEFQQVDGNTVHSNWMFAVKFIGNKSYDVIEQFFNKKDIEVRPLFYPIKYHNHLKNYTNNSMMADKLNNEVVILPSYPELEDFEIEKITNCVKEYKCEHV